MDKKEYIIDSVERLEAAISRIREAQKVFATYTQEQVDKIFLAAASAANKARIPLAKMAVEETGMGVVEDKVIKNNYASESIYNAYKNTKTCGVIEEDKAYGTKVIAEPIGVIAAVIPTTNPTSTAIFKCLLALKTRNAIIISPHPRAKNSTIAAAKLVLEAAVAAGAPQGIIDWIDVPRRISFWQREDRAWLRRRILPESRLWASVRGTPLLLLMTVRISCLQSAPLSIPRPLITE